MTGPLAVQAGPFYDRSKKSRNWKITQSERRFKPTLRCSATRHHKPPAEAAGVYRRTIRSCPHLHVLCENTCRLKSPDRNSMVFLLRADGDSKEWPRFSTKTQDILKLAFLWLKEKTGNGFACKKITQFPQRAHSTEYPKLGFALSHTTLCTLNDIMERTISNFIPLSLYTFWGNSPSRLWWRLQNQLGWQF